jgi:signal transduction protein with GAF and PtsI domain
VIIRKRDRLLSRLPSAKEILRGSLLQRTIRHRQGCTTCERGEGHPVSVLAVGYAGRGMRHISLRKDQVAQVKRALENYRKLKTALEEICELNQQLLRAEPAERKPEGHR